MNKIGVEEFIERSKTIDIIDVRSPIEFQEGYIPGAINLPLFNDEERKHVGILYKNSGREASVLAGLEFIGPKLASFIKELRQITNKKEILLHCWRGGMRSASMAWLFELSGYTVYLLEGGYKAYRKYIREKLGEELELIILGGKTGSGKSDILQELKNLGEQIIDLEGIANHKGSAFGDLGQDNQPTNEQFENILFEYLSLLDLKKTIWVEDESRGIGTISIPDPFYQQIRSSVIIFLDVLKPVRVKRLVKEYAGFDPEKLIAATERISKRLGGLNTNLAIDAIRVGNFEPAADLLLNYYDKAYLKGLSFRQPNKIKTVRIDNDNPNKNALKVISVYRQFDKSIA